MRRRLAGLALVVVLAGCGVPTSGDPETIPAAEIPYGLASPTPTDATTAPMETTLVQTGIYLVTPEDILVARGRELSGGQLDERLEELLGQLAIGPSAQELADELSSSLPPEVELEVTEVADGTVTIDIAGPVEAPTGSESRLAVGQIVLTATSLAGVRAVRLTREGDVVDAPLPDGELTSAPLTADDYAAFLTAPAPSATPAATSATPSPSPPS